MSLMYYCATKVCTEYKTESHPEGERAFYCVWVARRESFAQFYSSTWYQCDDCSCSDDGQLFRCGLCCYRLASETERKRVENEYVRADRDEWVEFLRHCATHGGMEATL